jgi:hypothetical protein
MGMPTDRLLRMVESNDTRAHLVASMRLAEVMMTRSTMGFSVLRFAGLEEGRIGTRLDEIAFGEGPEEPQRLAFDLAADDERGIESQSAFLEVFPVAELDVAYRVRNHDRYIEHRANAPDVRHAALRITSLFQNADDRLCSCETPGTQQHDHPIAHALKNGHLAKLRKIVDACVGAGIRREDHPLLEQNADAVGHVVTFFEVAF